MIVNNLMMFPATLFTILFLSLATNVIGDVRANRSPMTLPMSRRVNLTSIHNLVRHDQTRAKLLKARASDHLAFQNNAVIDSQVDDQAVSYVSAVGIGAPATFYSFTLDTGSSNVLLFQPYVRTGTTVPEPNTVSVTTGSGSFFGNEFIDTVTIQNPPALVVRNQPIAVASSSSGFAGVDGILGLGPTGLTLGTLSPATNTLVPTIVDNAFAQGIISADEICFGFRPTNTSNSAGGVLTWGGVDSTLFTGTISFSPITNTSPANQFWGITQSIRYGSSTAILAQTAGIVDIGTTLILIATDAFSKYQTATGGVLDSATGLLRITSAQFANLKSLFFQTQGLFELTANAQIWPRPLNTLIGGTSSAIYLIVNDIGSPSGSGLDFINGMVFLERFYVVLDTTNKRVGLANTAFTHAIIN